MCRWLEFSMCRWFRSPTWLTSSSKRGPWWPWCPASRQLRPPSTILCSRCDVRNVDWDWVLYGNRQRNELEIFWLNCSKSWEIRLLGDVSHYYWWGRSEVVIKFTQNVGRLQSHSHLKSIGVCWILSVKHLIDTGSTSLGTMEETSQRLWWKTCERQTSGLHHAPANDQSLATRLQMSSPFQNML